MSKADRGFASMDKNKQREIARKGGKAAHQKRTAHEWTSEEAREAGRKGGMAIHRKQEESRGQESLEPGVEDLRGEPMNADMSVRRDWPV
jgi:general stress protein YciG